MKWLCISFSLLLQFQAPGGWAQVVINEISDKGTSDVCSGEDWVELYNEGTTDVSLAGYLLYDVNGPDDDDAFVFPEDTTLPTLDYLILCCDGDGVTSNESGVQNWRR